MCMRVHEVRIAAESSGTVPEPTFRVGKRPLLSRRRLLWESLGFTFLQCAPLSLRLVFRKGDLC